MNAAAQAVLDSALAKIEADGRDWATMRDKVKSDARYIALTEYAKRLEQDVTSDGCAGFSQIMGQVMSARYWRAKRAAELAVAREGQVKGMHGYAKAWLRRAAAHRKDEHLYREANKPRLVTLDMATDAFCAALSASPSMKKAG